MSTATAPIPNRTAADELDLDDLTARLRIGAMRLSRRLRQQSSGGLTLSQISALTVIDRHGPMTLGELSEFERVEPDDHEAGRQAHRRRPHHQGDRPQRSSLLARPDHSRGPVAADRDPREP